MNKKEYKEKLEALLDLHPKNSKKPLQSLVYQGYSRETLRIISVYIRRVSDPERILSAKKLLGK